MERYGNENPGAFQPTRPLRGATKYKKSNKSSKNISTHAPLAGRDLRALCGAAQKRRISTHAPLAGRDYFVVRCQHFLKISTHAPLAGRDYGGAVGRRHKGDFNPRAPCGARPQGLHSKTKKEEFQPTRPLRGATGQRGERETFIIISTHAPLAGRDAPAADPLGDLQKFQPTRPLRGATFLLRP